MTMSAVTALAEPTEPVPARWTVAISLANVGLFTAWFGPIQVLLGREAEALAPAHKEAALGLVVGAGAAFAVVASPLFGALSDRTVSRFGRRLPWVVAGGLTGALSLLLVAFAPNIAVMTIGWCATQLTLNAMFAAIVAGVPDQVPHRQRGMVGGWLGVAQTLGIVAGSALAAATGGLVAGYLACIAVLLVAALPYLLLPGLRARPGGAPALGLAGLPARVLDRPAALPRLRLGVAHPVPGGARCSCCVPAL